jgi:hypothetical protein
MDNPLREHEALVIFHTSVATTQSQTGKSLGLTRERGR